MQKFELMKYFTKGVIGLGLISGYDVLVDQKSFMDYALKDGGLFALSSIISDYLIDIISGFIAM